MQKSATTSVRYAPYSNSLLTRQYSQAPSPRTQFDPNSAERPSSAVTVVEAMHTLYLHNTISDLLPAAAIEQLYMLLHTLARVTVISPATQLRDVTLDERPYAHISNTQIQTRTSSIAPCRDIPIRLCLLQVNR